MSRRSMKIIIIINKVLIKVTLNKVIADDDDKQCLTSCKVSRP